MVLALQKPISPFFSVGIFRRPQFNSSNCLLLLMQQDRIFVSVNTHIVLISKLRYAIPPSNLESPISRTTLLHSAFTLPKVPRWERPIKLPSVNLTTNHHYHAPHIILCPSLFQGKSGHPLVGAPLLQHHPTSAAAAAAMLRKDPLAHIPSAALLHGATLGEDIESGAADFIHTC